MNALKQDIIHSWMRSNQDFSFHQKDSERLRKIHERWDSIISNILLFFQSSSSSSLSHDKDHLQNTSNKWISNLIKLHSHPDRHYHTLAHLEEMFGYIDLIVLYNSTETNDSLNHKWSLLMTVTYLSVFFHDAIYDATSGTNEEDSVSLFQKFMKEFISMAITATTSSPSSNSSTDSNDNCLLDKWPGTCIVERFIMATKTHNASHLPNNTDADELFFLHLFLDADMSVLGKEPKAYDAYASMIRREYIHVPHQVYCEKRSDILQSFVGDLEDETKSKSIYLSNDMKSALETQAISNLRREISSLRSGIIPNS